MKQTLLDIRRKTNVTTKAIAEHARLPVADVFALEVGGFLPRATAGRVVTAFNQLSGMRVTVDDVRMRDAAFNNSSHLSVNPVSSDIPPAPSQSSDIPTLRNRNLTALSRGKYHG